MAGVTKFAKNNKRGVGGVGGEGVNARGDLYNLCIS